MKLYAQPLHVVCPLWESGKMTRSQAYEIVGAVLGVPKSQARIGSATNEQCATVIAALREWDDA